MDKDLKIECHNLSPSRVQYGGTFLSRSFLAPLDGRRVGLRQVEQPNQFIRGHERGGGGGRVHNVRAKNFHDRYHHGQPFNWRRVQLTPTPADTTGRPQESQPRFQPCHLPTVRAALNG